MIHRLARPRYVIRVGVFMPGKVLSTKERSLSTHTHRIPCS